MPCCNHIARRYIDDISCLGAVFGRHDMDIHYDGSDRCFHALAARHSKKRYATRITASQSAIMSQKRDVASPPCCCRLRRMLTLASIYSFKMLIGHHTGFQYVKRSASPIQSATFSLQSAISILMPHEYQNRATVMVSK